MYPTLIYIRSDFHGNWKITLMCQVYINKADLRDFIAVTSLEILLKFD